MIDISNEAKKEFLRDGSKKYIKVVFPNGEHRDLGNSDIVSESLEFQENLCQQNTFKFGICESNYITFKTGSVTQNIKGKEIIVSIGVMVNETIEYVPLGRFLIDSCKKDRTGVRVIEAYTNKFDEKRKVTPFELWKRSWYSESDSYSVNSRLYAYQEKKATSNLKPQLKNVIFDSATVTYQDGANTFSIYYKVLEFGLKESGFNNTLISFSYDKKDCFDEATLKIDEMMNKVSNAKYRDYNVTRVGFSQRLKDSSSSTYFTSYKKVWKTTWGDECILPDVYGEPDVLYLFNDQYNSESVIRVAIPYGCDGTAGQNSYTFIDPNSIKVYEYPSITSSLSAYDLKLPRTAKKTVKFYTSSGTSKTKTVYYVDEENIKTVINPYAYLELCGRFGRINRLGEFEEFTIGINKTLFPNVDLYPDNSLYPDVGDSGYVQAFRNQIESLYIEEDESEPINKNVWIGTVLFDYRNNDDEVVVGKMVLDEYAEGVYYIEKNEALINNKWNYDDLVWDIKTVFVSNATKIFPWKQFEVNLKGMPWIESGDVLSVPDKDSQVVGIVLSRNLKGIASLKDNIVSDVDFGDYENIVEEGEA